MALNLFLYRKGKSLFHRIPAFIKLIFLFSFCSLVFVEKSYFLFLSLLICAASFFLAECSIRTFSNLKFLIFVSVFIIVIKSIDFSASGFSFSNKGIYEGLIYCARFSFVSFFAEIVFETTSSLEIRRCLENVENVIAFVFPPIKKINPSLIVSLAITFIPQVFETWNRVHLAVRSKSPQKRKSLHQAVSILMTELTALISCLIRSAETKRLSLLNRTSDSSLNDIKK